MTLLLHKEDIEEQIYLLSTELNFIHSEIKEPVVFVGLLNGCFMFYSDLVRELNFDIECDFMRIKSYIKKNVQGDIKITKDLETSIKNKHVYIIDDIFDTGNTMKVVSEFLSLKWPKSLNIITLAARNKKEWKWNPKLDSSINSFYYLFDVDDEWLVGYGMDDENKTKRNLNSIYSV